MKLNYKTVPFVMTKQMEDDEFFEFEGYASTFNNIDDGYDMVMPGAFKACTDRMRKEGETLPILWQHDMSQPLGIYTEYVEDEKGLFVKGRMPKSDSFVSGRVIPQMKVKSISKMSIGYVPLRKEWSEDGLVRKLKEIDLWEVSLVTRPMNPKADITGMKSASPFKNLPVAATSDWDSEAASKRVEELGEDGAYLIEGEEKKYLIADVIDGKLTIMPEALQQAAIAIAADFRDEIPAQLKNHIERYCEKIETPSPFVEKTCVRIENLSKLNARRLERAFRAGVCLSQSQAKFLTKLITDSRRDVDQPGRDVKELQEIIKLMKSF